MSCDVYFIYSFSPFTFYQKKRRGCLSIFKAIGTTLGIEMMSLLERARLQRTSGPGQYPRVLSFRPTFHV